MWSAVTIGAVGCYLCKLAGVSLPERVLHGPRTRHVAALLPVALLATLVAVQTFATGRHLVVDARAAALGVALVALLQRALAAATAALLRLSGR